MALNGTCWAARLHTTISGPNSSSAALTAPLPVALEPALGDAHHGAGQAEAEHREAHHQRAEMRPAADREHAHDADLQRDDAAGDQADGQIEGKRRAMVEIDGSGQGTIPCWERVIQCVMARGEAARHWQCARSQRICSSAVVRADDLVAFELGEGHEGHDLAAVDVLAATW